LDSNFLRDIPGAEGDIVVFLHKARDIHASISECRVPFAISSSALEKDQSFKFANATFYLQATKTHGGETIALRVVSPIACKISLTLITDDDILEVGNDDPTSNGLLASIPTDKLKMMRVEADGFVSSVFKNSLQVSNREDDTFIQIYVKVGISIPLL
jgi:hypothetical protein